MLLTITVSFSFGCGCGSDLEIITDKTVYTPSAQREEKEVYSLTYEYLGGKDVMPIGTFFGPFTPTNGMINGTAFGDYNTDYYFDLMQKVGINMINYVGNQWREHKPSMQKSLALCKKYNIGYFMNDYALRQDFASIGSAISEYIDEDCILGNFLRDEPYKNQFEDVKKAYEEYAKFTDKTLYVNLFPNYQSDLTKTSEVITWEEYLREFLTISNAKCLSYDYYPFEYANRGTSGMKNYYLSLSIARRVAEDFKVPFWCYIQCGDIWDSTVGASTVEIYPNESEFLWNVNTCLAYGAKSVVYHTFLQPYYMATTETGYDFDTMGLIGADGSINRWYYYAQKANKELKAIDHILMNSVNIGVIALGDDLAKNIEGNEKITEKALRELTSVVADKDNALIGCFDYKGKTAFYAVNCETASKQRITFKFDDKYGYEVIQRGESVKVAGKELTLTLEAGEGALIALL